MVIILPCATAVALPSKSVVRALTNLPWGPEFSLLKEVQPCCLIAP